MRAGVDTSACNWGIWSDEVTAGDCSRGSETVGCCTDEDEREDAVTDFLEDGCGVESVLSISPVLKSVKKVKAKRNLGQRYGEILDSKALCLRKNFPRMSGAIYIYIYIVYLFNGEKTLIKSQLVYKMRINVKSKRL